MSTGSVPTQDPERDDVEAHYAALERLDDGPERHGCIEGWVWLGRDVERPDGTTETVHEPVRCKRCAREPREGVRPRSRY